MRGGRAFNGPLPFPLGGFVQGMTGNANQVACLQACGMTMSRLEASWTTYEYDAPFETAVGVYSSSAASLMATAVAAHKAAGITPMIVMTNYDSPQLCPLLNTALTNGTVYTSINVGSSSYPSQFGISIGDSIVITDGNNQSHTQTVTATSSLSAGSYGSVSVTSFTANNNYPLKSWIYDTAWSPCTPQHLANAMGWLVAQSGLQGVRWEILNEPDNGPWPSAQTEPTQYAQMMKLVYAAMKAADPTCIVHGFVLANVQPISYGYGGLVWASSAYSAGMAQGVTHDAISVHIYNSGGPPLGVDSYTGMTQPQIVGNARAFFVSKGDYSPIWITEWGWTWPPLQTQAQYLQDGLQAFSGIDPVNGVLFSSYLKGIMQYSCTGVNYNYALFGTSGTPSTPNPAVAVLAEVVSGR